ncbi:MAG: stage II sporulation protein M [Chloroflexota bacterium]
MMRHDFSLVWLISRRELRDQLRDWRVLFPLIVLTLIFPFLMNEVARQAVEYANQYGGNLIIDRLVPFSILIIGFFPITVSLVVALESFVGEKERGTIEPLLSTPLYDYQLYFGKLIVGIITPLVASFAAIGLYLIIVSRQDIAMPDPAVMAQLILLTISHAVLMVSAAIVFSVQSTSVKAANLLASFIVIPVAILMQGETVLLFWGNNQVLWLAVVAVLILAGLLIRVGLAHFQREYLLGREIDMLNLRWMARSFWQAFKGDAHSLGGWYRHSVGGTVRKMSPSILVLAALAVASFFWGLEWTNRNVGEVLAKASPEQVADIREEIGETITLGEFNLNISAPALFLHNLRAVLTIGLLGLFSFSVLGMIAYLINIGVVGALLGLFDLMGQSPWLMLVAGILPHGVFEIPALVLSSAAVLQLGVVLVAPQMGKTIGEVLIEAVAHWARVIVGLVVPLLAVAAVIEVYVTPHLLEYVIG